MTVQLGQQSWLTRHRLGNRPTPTACRPLWSLRVNPLHLICTDRQTDRQTQGWGREGGSMGYTKYHGLFLRMSFILQFRAHEALVEWWCIMRHSFLQCQRCVRCIQQSAAFSHTTSIPGTCASRSWASWGLLQPGRPCGPRAGPPTPADCRTRCLCPCVYATALEQPDWAGESEITDTVRVTSESQTYHTDTVVGCQNQNLVIIWQQILLDHWFIDPIKTPTVSCWNDTQAVHQDNMPDKMPHMINRRTVWW